MFNLRRNIHFFIRLIYKLRDLGGILNSDINKFFVLKYKIIIFYLKILKLMFQMGPNPEILTER